MIVDASLAPGRIDVVLPKAGEPVDFWLILHTRGNPTAFTKELSQALVALSPGAHIRARGFSSQRESSVLIVTSNGWGKWCTGREGKPDALRIDFHEPVLAAYRSLARSHAPRDAHALSDGCSHETCFEDGGVLYWAGVK